MDSDTSKGASPFFLPGLAGNLFALYHHPADPASCRGGVLYFHPFANEMNYTRRAAALLARALAGRGWGVLQVDLFGCGDSDGDFRDASWETWIDDLTSAFGWLQGRVGGRVGLVGIRLGGLLALDFASRTRRNIDRVLLWHPVVNGQQMMTDFLRLRLLSNAIGERVGESTNTQKPRPKINSAQPVEVVGYELNPHFGEAIAKIHIAQLGLSAATPIQWVEVVLGADDSGRPLAQTTVHDWQAAGREATLHRVAGRPFWSSPRIQDSRDTTDIIVRIFEENHQ
jgi:exosortase A-associated hydrolase 2